MQNRDKRLRSYGCFAMVFEVFLARKPFACYPDHEDFVRNSIS